MFKPNPKMIKTEYISNDTEMLDSAVRCWNPTLNIEVYLDASELLEDFTYEVTKEKPKPYAGNLSLNTEWATLTHKTNKDLIFWIDADAFMLDDSGEITFIDNAGLDIDLSEISIDFESIIYTNDESISWNVGSIEDSEQGKVFLYSAVESNESTGEDKDGDEEFGTVPQDKFEAIRQLFVQAGFTVKVKRLPRNN